MRLAVTTWIGLLLLISTMSAGAVAAEICFKRQCQPAGTPVLLGDVAEVLGADEETLRALAELELLPAPPAGMRRYVRVRQIKDLLQSRGVNLARHQFSGADQVAIGGPVPRPGGRGTTTPRPSRFASRRARQRVQEAIVRYLHSAASAEEPWQVQVELDPDQTRRLAAGGDELKAEGGTEPWLGRQVFLVRVGLADGAQSMRIAANVSLPPLVVVAVQALPAGAMVRPSDVRLTRETTAAAARSGGARVMRTLEQVVGLETARAITTNQILDQSSVRQPLLVRRNDVVTVYARAAGISVRINARSREDGSREQLVMVESLTDRRRFLARVTGVREVDIYAGSVRAGQTKPARLALAPE